MTKKPDAELSPLAKQLLGNAGAIQVFTQIEFDEALALAQAEIMTMAIEASRQAVMIEREECAKIIDKWAESLAGEPKMKEIADEIRNRIPSQRQ